jgi:hypothetical protein
MAAQGADAEVKALEKVIAALSSLDDESRGRVLQYVLTRFGEAGRVQTSTPSISQALPTPAAVATPEEAPVVPPGTDIRSLKDQKSPRSAVEMAVLVAFYAAELAPGEERRETIGTAEIDKYFKQAGYRLPSTPRLTLHQAKNAGYIDSASHGQYKLNPVGYNLVVHGLPSESSRTAKKTSRSSVGRKTTRARKKPTKKTTRKTTRGRKRK